MINNIRSKFENKSPTFYRGKKKQKLVQLATIEQMHVIVYFKLKK